MLELQLGLTLASNSMQGFDLNCCAGYEPKEVVGLNPLINKAMHQLSPSFSSRSDNGNQVDNKKRSFDDAFENNRAVPRTLPLLLWNNQPHEDDDPKDFYSHPSFAINQNNGDSVVGWPPIKSSRKKHCHQNNRSVENECGYGVIRSSSNYMFVKVKMEGVAIARKIDLTLHHSFLTLKSTLINMFGTCQEDSNCYKLTYQDSEGDWLLAEDIPWRSFVRSVQRLKLLRSTALLI
ncbi:AUX_IAA domain-containing protein [Cephalotus follicularis]|uniref:Auxin-responsive protein n=1 Tax=Cephalotus follicularis TaxID=3775 RepID=A0A1Q3D0G3_CEPFO|nr:AUX_IAA domain-containing protein [Cephalotus follicularis]